MLAPIHRALKPGGWLVLVEFRRVPGKSAPRLVKHVRAGREVFTRNRAGRLSRGGFVRFPEAELHRRFRKVAKE
jgi:hypothetical protein